MTPFSTPKAKKIAPSSPVSQRQGSSSSAPASSLVPCPICEKSIPEWFVNNHLDNDCTGMENVAESLSQVQQQEAVKRKHGEIEEFEDMDESAMLHDLEETDNSSSAQEPGHPKSTSQQQPYQLQSYQLQPYQQQHTPTSSLTSAFSSGNQNRKERANAAVQRSMPLAERARPTNLEDYIGQKELVGPGGMLRALVLQDTVPKAFEDAKNLFQLTRQRTIIFLDEIHRFTKSQQDIFLPFVEKGTITLIGATTENPSFRINSALLSRCRVLTLEKLTLKDGMDRMIRRAARIKWHDILNMVQDYMPEADVIKFNETIAKDEKSVDEWIDATIEDGAVKWLIDLSDGDGRSAINTLEIAIQAISTWIISKDGFPEEGNASSAGDIKNEINVVDKLLSVKVTAESVKAAFQKTHLQYDRQGDEHYNLISALHKSIRGSDGDAALYWLGRMLVAGEEPLYIARRLIRLASEDIGVADSAALPLAVATYQACQMIGMPECDVNLAHCVAYMANAKKSVDVYHAYGLVKQTVAEEFAYPVPIHLRNAPTTLMKDLGYGEDYKYNPSYPTGVTVDQEYFPKGLKKRKFLGEVPVMKLNEDGQWTF
ncbi:Werner helicase interacting protein 1 [Mortierella claussenii]|nr:Werner helicase interacting protein 1 [Mortierella claussenii]